MTEGGSLRTRAAALLMSSYIGGVTAFAVARIGFRLLAIAEGAPTILTLGKTATFVLFTGPARAVGIVLVVFPFLIRSPLRVKRLAVTTGGSLAVLLALYIRVQWHAELAQANHVLGVAALVLVASTFVLTTSLLAPRLVGAFDRLWTPASMALTATVIGLSLALGALGILEIVFSDL